MHRRLHTDIPVPSVRERLHDMLWARKKLVRCQELKKSFFQTRRSKLSRFKLIIDARNGLVISISESYTTAISRAVAILSTSKAVRIASSKVFTGMRCKLALRVEGISSRSC